MCVLSLSWNFVSHDKYIARPSSKEPHRQYNRDWGTSYSRPPIDPYLTSPCYKIMAAPLASRQRNTTRYEIDQTSTPNSQNLTQI